MDLKHLIEPENIPTWTAAGFIVALLALVVAFSSLHRTNVVLLGTQTEVLVLTKKIGELETKLGASVPAPQASAEVPAMPAKK